MWPNLEEGSGLWEKICVEGAPWEGPLFSGAAAGSASPPPKPTHLPTYTLSLPYKLAHSSSHPLRGQPNGPSETFSKHRVRWEHPVWAKFTCPFPTPVTCAPGRRSTTGPGPDTDAATESIQQVENTRQVQSMWCGRRPSGSPTCEFVFRFWLNPPPLSPAAISPCCWSAEEELRLLRQQTESHRRKHSVKTRTKSSKRINLRNFRSCYAEIQATDALSAHGAS